MVFVWRAVTFTSIGAVGLLTNTIVVLVMLKSKSLMKIESSKFIVNQSFIDAVTSFLIITSHTNLVDYLGVVQDNYKDGNIGDEILCRFWNFDLIQWSFNTASTINLVIMTVEKYLKICHSIWYRTKVRTVHHRITMAFPWILGPVYQLAIYIHTLDVIDNVCVLHIWPSGLLSRIVGVFAVCFEFIIPIILFIFCYSSILRTLKTRFLNLPVSGESSSSSTQGRKYIKTLTTDGSQSDVTKTKDPIGEENYGSPKQLQGKTNSGFTDITEDGRKADKTEGKEVAQDLDGQREKEDQPGKKNMEILDVTKLQKRGSQSKTKEFEEEFVTTSTLCCYSRRQKGTKSSKETTKQDQNRSQPQETASRAMDKQNLKSQRKVIRILITVSVAFFFCWVCNQTIIFCTNIGLVDGEIFYSFIYTISGITAYMNCCVNPFIYVAQFHKFRHIAYNGFTKCRWEP